VRRDALDAAQNVLRNTFGHADFRGLQAGVIGEILAGRSALAVLPTGGGKSICYQIPSLVRPGLKWGHDFRPEYHAPDDRRSGDGRPVGTRAQASER
jgi:superfamily II DNA helicase RecQ